MMVMKKNGDEIIRYGYKIDGKIYNQRHIRKMIGTAKKEEVIKALNRLVMIDIDLRYPKDRVKEDYKNIAKI